MKCVSFSALLLIWCVQSFAADAPMPNRIELFYDNKTTIAGVDAVKHKLPKGIAIQTYNFNAPDTIEAALSRGLPPNLADAQRRVMDRIQRMGRAAFEQQMIRAYQGVVQANRYRLDRYPAVVFDNGVAVVYGVTDLRTALEHYWTWKSEP